MSPTLIALIAAKQADKAGFPIGIVIFPPLLAVLLVICGMKGKWGTVVALVIATGVFAVGTGFDAVTIIGVTLVESVIAGVAAVRLAKSGSYWAQRRYDAEKLEKAGAYHESESDD